MKDFLRLKMIKYGEIYIEIKSLMFENEIKREKIGFLFFFFLPLCSGLYSKLAVQNNLAFME